MRYALFTAGLLALAGCDATAPVDNAAATGCAPGTPEDSASSVCKDVHLGNGDTVAVPATDASQEAYLDNTANAY